MLAGNVPASIAPDQRPTILSIETSKSSPSRKGLLAITIASLNSPSARILEAVNPLLEILACLPCT